MNDALAWFLAVCLIITITIAAAGFIGIGVVLCVAVGIWICWVIGFLVIVIRGGFLRSRWIRCIGIGLIFIVGLIVWVIALTGAHEMEYLNAVAFVDQLF